MGEGAYGTVLKAVRLRRSAQPLGADPGPGSLAGEDQERQKMAAVMTGVSTNSVNLLFSSTSDWKSERPLPFHIIPRVRRDARESGECRGSGGGGAGLRHRESSLRTPHFYQVATLVPRTPSGVGGWVPLQPHSPSL